MTDYDAVAKLVQQAQKGSKAAFSELYKRYFSRVYYMALRRLADENQAAEAAQETFLRMLTKLDTLKNPHAFDKWVFLLANHEIVAIASSRTTEEVSIDELIEENFDWTPEVELAPEDYLQRAEDRAEILAAIRKLSGKQRDVIILRYFNGLSVAEIASLLSTAPDTISKRLFDAHAQLRRLAPGAPEPALTAVLHEDADSYDYRPAQAQVAAGLALLGPTLSRIASTGAHAATHAGHVAHAATHAAAPGATNTALVAQRIQAFQRLAEKNPALTAGAATGAGAGAAATASIAASAVATKIVVAVAALALVAGGGVYALARHNAGTASDAGQSKPPVTHVEGKTPPSKTTKQAAASTTTSTGTTSTAVSASRDTATTTYPQESGLPRGGGSDQDLPPGQAAQARAPVITVSHAEVRLPVGAKPSLTQLLALIGARATDSAGADLEVTVTGYDLLDARVSGTQPLFLHALDAHFTPAKTVLVSINFISPK
ncbi:MAG: sigma-70 family RNA polymerase sigma factor [Coriobacteriia bacterium]|nr:sigma-70 family RNA polymerase sigma factor [Coriobacteriia bacterium]